MKRQHAINVVVEAQLLANAAAPRNPVGKRKRPVSSGSQPHVSIHVVCAPSDLCGVASHPLALVSGVFFVVTLALTLGVLVGSPEASSNLPDDGRVSWLSSVDWFTDVV